jgi:hypothetical protein
MAILLKNATVALLLLLLSLGTVYAAFPTAKKAQQATAQANNNTVSVQKTAVPAVSNEKELKSITSAKNKAFGGGKSKGTAILLAIFLGTFGAHSFYMGKTVKGFAQLGLTLVGLGLFIAGVASVSTDGTIPATALIGYLLIFGVSIWALVDLVRILTGSLEPEEGFDS